MFIENKNSHTKCLSYVDLNNFGQDRQKRRGQKYSNRNVNVQTTVKTSKVKGEKLKL